jgi:hypothetical protein
MLVRWYVEGYRPYILIAPAHREYIELECIQKRWPIEAVGVE